MKAVWILLVFTWMLGGCGKDEDDADNEHGDTASSPESISPEGNTDENSSDSDEGPGDSDENPTDSDGNPGETDGNPTDSDGNPGETDGNPTDSDENPGDSDENPGDSDENPTDSDGNPGDSDGNPGETDENPTDSDTALSDTEDTEQVPEVELPVGNGTWALVGERGFAVSPAMSTGVRNIELVVHEDTLYVGYVVYQNREAEVWRFADGTWTALGQAAEQADRISLTMDPVAEEIVAATDESVVRFDGTAWKPVGEGGIGDQGAIVATSDGLFLAWEGNDYNLWIDKLTDDEFILQECSMTRKRAENYHLAAGPDGALFASAKLYIKGSTTTHGGVVYGFDSDLNAWKELGGVIHDGNEVYDNDLAVSAAGIPYLAYCDYLGSSFSVVRYNGEGDWTFVGPENILGGIGYNPAITFSPSGSVPIAAYTESAQQSSGYPRVMYYNGSQWVQLGESYDSISDESMKAHPAVAVGADGTVYTAYWDLVDGNAAITVKKYSEKFDVSGALAEDENGGGDSAVAVKDAPRAAWPVVGTYGFTEDLDGIGLGATALIVDDNNDLYAGYIDASSSTADAGVWKFDGAAWSDFGDVSAGVDFTGGLSLLSQGGTLYAGVSTGLYSATEQDAFSLVADGKLQGNLAADPVTGTVYSLVYASSTKQLVVSELDAGIWAPHSAVDVPQDNGLDHAASPSLAVAKDGTLYMSYQLQNAGTLFLMQYNGIDWEVLDTPIADASEEVYKSKLLLSPSDVPHLVIVEAHATLAAGVSADDLSVLRFENGTHKWLQRRSILWGGDASEGAVSEPSAVFTSDGTLYVAFTYKLGTAGPIQALVYNEAADMFEVIGGRDVINGHWESLADRAVPAVDGNDNVYLGYDDGNNAYRFTVRRLVTW